MSNEPAPSAHPGLEIASRVVKLVIYAGNAVSWFAAAVGAYSVYALWTTEKESEWMGRIVQSRLELGWMAIGVMLLVRLAQMAIGWAVLVPLEAKIQGINLRDPEVASELRTSSWMRLALEGLSFAVYVAVPLLIAHFRFRHFV
jgi:hypothetical protein